ncbi:putative phage associated protein [Neisseria meningitidis 77221]|nr:putative phage associated protein [Neisseria meningitidis 77221]
MQKVYVVQSVSTGDFLYLSPETGDIGHTKLITNADYFYDFEEGLTQVWKKSATNTNLSYSDF